MSVLKNKSLNNEELLSKEKSLSAYKHHEFWYSVDTLRDKNYLEELWNKKQAPWKIW